MRKRDELALETHGTITKYQIVTSSNLTWSHGVFYTWISNIHHVIPELSICAYKLILLFYFKNMQKLGICMYYIIILMSPIEFKIKIHMKFI